MDKHFNIFYSYNAGKDREVEKHGILEDNITRALMVTLLHLQQKEQNQFVRRLLKCEVEFSVFCLDLQSLKKDDLPTVHRTPLKILVVITRSPHEISRSDFSKIADDPIVHRIDKLTESEKKKLLSKIARHLNQDQDTEKKLDIQIDNQLVEVEDLQSLYEVLKGSRPDAWIFSPDYFAIAIESKIGNSVPWIYQLYRHLVNYEGLHLANRELKAKNAFSLVSITWEEISNLLFDVAPQDTFVKEFRRYLVMAGQVLSLAFYVDPEVSIDSFLMKEQFGLLLECLDKKISRIEPIYEGLGILKRAGRPQENLWDYYGFAQTGQKVEKNPHISVGLGESGTAIELTLRSPKTIKYILASEKFRSHLEGLVTTGGFDLQRYHIYLSCDRIVDYVRGVIRGEKTETMKLSSTLEELAKRGKGIDTFLKCLQEMVPFGKQFGFGYRVNSFDYSKKPRPGMLKAENMLFFEKPNHLVSKYSDFVTSILPFAEEIRGLE